VVVSGYVTFYQINKFFIKNLFIINKKSLLVGFGSQAVVWRSLP